MNLDRESPSVDEYLMTALQIFDYCDAERSGTLRVEELMDKFAPFMKTNKAEYSCLKSILDPDRDNPEINVTKLAQALHKYSETQKTKVDFDDSFNLRSGQVPQDSDSGISTDGLMILEELQTELRAKAHLAHQLRSQLEFTDRQHEEALASLTAERDSLRVHLNMLRDENMQLTHVKRDYEEACDRLCASEQALAELRRETEAVKKKARVMHEQVSCLENEKLTLQEQLTKSKDECHRINENYAARQSTLLEQNETLKAENADLASKLQDQEEFMQQMIKEKILLEMELKDVLNKSNHTHLRLDRSIDISYTEDQMLTALDSLNADSRFTQDVATVGTQANEPCSDCEKNKVLTPRRNLKRFFWDPLKCMFQVFAVVCFVLALCALYGVTRRWHAQCTTTGTGARREPLPWRWLHAQDFMDLFLRIDYGAVVPM